MSFCEQHFNLEERLRKLEREVDRVIVRIGIVVGGVVFVLQTVFLLTLRWILNNGVGA